MLRVTCKIGYNPSLFLFLPCMTVVKYRTFLLIAFIPFLLFFLCDVFAPVNLHPDQGSRLVLAKNGQPLRAFADEEGVWRYPVTLDEVSPNYLEALIGYEDRYFYQHPGVNPLALGRALLQAIRYGQVVSGGSTLTMQVARLRYPEPRTLWGKAKEMVRALQLELHFSKQEILTYYLNHAPFGGTVEGVQAASLTYFGYDAQYLTDAQAALLAVLPQAPTRYRPDLHPEVAQRARDKLLRRLQANETWAAERVTDAMLETVTALPREFYQDAPLLARRLAGATEQSTVPTFIDASWQQQVADRVQAYVETISDGVSAAVLIMNNETGEVPVYVGSADFASVQRAGHVDMVQAIRSPGSTLKPFIYGLAMDEGLIHSESLLMDVPLRFSDYQPDNFNSGFSGAVSVSGALQSSLNVPAVQVLDQLGPARLYLALQQAGARLRLPSGEAPNLSIALGGLGADLESLVRLFSSLDRAGQSIQPRYQPTDEVNTHPLLSPGAAWIIRRTLADSPSTPHGLALKTGTSYGFRDSWAVAVADGYTIGVWVGRPDGAPVTGHFGARTAVPLLVNTLLPVLSANVLPAQPETVRSQTICWPTGQPETTALCDERRQAWILDETVPASLMMAGINQGQPNRLMLNLATDSGLQVPFGCELDSTQTEVALWPLPLNAWRPQAQRVQSRLPDFDPRCNARLRTAARLPLTLAGARDGDVIATDPNDPVPVSLWAEGGQPPYFWYLNGELQTHRGASFQFIPRPQFQYEVVLMDYQGRLDRQTIGSD